MMATSQSYHDYILDQFRLAEGITTRKMMGEYVLYVQGRVMGGLYDDRLMVKPTAAARALPISRLTVAMAATQGV